MRSMNVMEQLHVLELPILVGISRKRMIHQLLGITAQESLNGNNCAKYDCTNERSKHFACTRCERSCRNGANLQPVYGKQNNNANVFECAIATTYLLKTQNIERLERETKASIAKWQYRNNKLKRERIMFFRIWHKKISSILC